MSDDSVTPNVGDELDSRKWYYDIHERNHFGLYLFSIDMNRNDVHLRVRTGMGPVSWFVPKRELLFGQHLILNCDKRNFIPMDFPISEFRNDPEVTSRYKRAIISKLIGVCMHNILSDENVMRRWVPYGSHKVLIRVSTWLRSSDKWLRERSGIRVFRGFRMNSYGDWLYACLYKRYDLKGCVDVSMHAMLRALSLIVSERNEVERGVLQGILETYLLIDKCESCFYSELRIYSGMNYDYDYYGVCSDPSSKDFRISGLHLRYEVLPHSFPGGKLEYPFSGPVVMQIHEHVYVSSRYGAPEVQLTFKDFQGFETAWTMNADFSTDFMLLCDYLYHGIRGVYLAQTYIGFDRWRNDCCNDLVMREIVPGMVMNLFEMIKTSEWYALPARRVLAGIASQAYQDKLVSKMRSLMFGEHGDLMKAMMSIIFDPCPAFDENKHINKLIVDEVLDSLGLAS